MSILTNSDLVKKIVENNFKGKIHWRHCDDCAGYVAILATHKFSLLSVRPKGVAGGVAARDLVLFNGHSCGGAFARDKKIGVYNNLEDVNKAVSRDVFPKLVEDQVENSDAMQQISTFL